MESQSVLKKRGRPFGSVQRPHLATESSGDSPNIQTQSLLQVDIQRRKTEEPGTAPRGRGRPKGWRKPGLSYAELRGDPPAKKRTANGEIKRRGRPPRLPKATPRELYLMSNPEYRPFCCEWNISPGLEKNCPAELHNLHTLRRHVLIVHGEAKRLVCHWGKCASQEHPPDFGDDMEAFDEHVEKTHITPFLWYMGDGCQNESASPSPQPAPDTLPPYLFKDGVQVTPSIKDQVLEDKQHRLQRQRKLRQLEDLKDENAPDEDEYMAQILGSLNQD